MTQKHNQLTPNQIQQFKSYLSNALQGSRRKLSGEQMIKLKKSHFNEYVKKIKYYARKDLQKIKHNNLNFFYKTDGVKNYQNKEEPTTILKKQKPIVPPEIKQPSYYYFGKAEISSMKQFIFLAEECHKLEQRANKIKERRRNSLFIKHVQRKVQSTEHPMRSSCKSLNLHLTLKSARQINRRIKQKKNQYKQTLRIHDTQYRTASKSLGSTNLTQNKRSSSTSLKMNKLQV